MKKFEEIEYCRPDLAQFIKTGMQLLERFEQASDYPAAREIIMALQDAEREIATMMTIAHIRNSGNTQDTFYDNEMSYINQTLPTLIPLQIRLYKGLLQSQFQSQIEAEFGNQIFDLSATELKIQDESIMAEKVEEANLCQTYQKLTAACRTTFLGETVNFYGLLKHMEHPDREHRRQAYLTWADLYTANSDALDGIFDQLIAVRVRMAGKLGFASYTDLAYLLRHRLDYGPEQVAEFRRQVLEIVVPACVKIRADQARRIGVDKLRYYDESLMFTDGNPEPIGNKEQMIVWAKEMYQALSPETAEFFDFMTEFNLFDLETRPGKRMGGYCTSLDSWQAPFIFSNFNGTSADVDVLTHEAGHAFAFYLSSRRQVLAEYEHSTNEISEIHSMSMEHFTYPWMGKFFGEKSEQYRYLHLCQSMTVLPYMMCVDEFQHAVYDRPAMSASERRAAWREIEARYMPWRDYDNVSFLEQGGFWMQKQHIFLYPFYYIDYALAQMGAFEFYGKAKQDFNAAWSDYLTLCRAGGSIGYTGLLNLANLASPFSDGGVARAVGHVIDEIETSPYKKYS